MMRFLSLFLTFRLLTACVPQPVEDEPPLVSMPPTGTVEASTLVSVFNQTCLSYFPDNEAIAVSFHNTGYSILEEPRDDFEKDFRILSNKKKSIFASFGNSILWWDGPRGTGGAIPFQFCRIEAELSNPEQAETALEQLVTPSGEKVELLVDEERARWRGGTVHSKFGSFQVSFDQSKYIHGLNQGKLSEECDGLEKCLVWGRAKLSIGPVRQQ